MTIQPSTSSRSLALGQVCEDLDVSMKENISIIYDALCAIYSKHRRNHRENPDSKQMCCMWSTDDPPDIIEGTYPIYDIEDAFDFRSVMKMR